MGFLERLGIKKDRAALPGTSKIDTGFDNSNLGSGLGSDDSFGNNANSNFMETDSKNPFQEDSFNKDQNTQQSNFNPSRNFSERRSLSNANNQNENFGSDMANKNMEIVSAKLDALKTELNSMNQRLENIEAIARHDKSNARRYTW